MAQKTMNLAVTLALFVALLVVVVAPGGGDYTVSADRTVAGQGVGPKSLPAL